MLNVNGTTHVRIIVIRQASVCSFSSELTMKLRTTPGMRDVYTHDEDVIHEKNWI